MDELVLTSLRLRDFRCFSALQLDLPRGTGLFIGENAQGKTSILEAVCVLLRLQSPRCTGLKELVRFGAEGFGTAGTLGERELRHFSAEAEHRLQIDGEPVKKPSAYLASSGLVVWMGNGDLELISGGGEVRRRYLDFLGSQLYPDYRAALKSVEKALRSRNALLKRDAQPPWREIDAWTEVLITHGTVLTALRADLVHRLGPHAAAAHCAVSGERAESLTLSWLPGNEPDFAAHLSRLRPDEARRRITLAGPHRDDVQLAINGLPAAAYASEGQQRTIALALKLAQATLLRERRGIAPILLLDDIFGELDPRRRNALLAALPADSQRLITTTHLDWMNTDLRPDALFRVCAGEVTEG